MENIQLKVPQPDEIHHSLQSYPAFQQNKKLSNIMNSNKHESPQKRKKSVTINCQDDLEDNFHKQYQKTIRDLVIEDYIDKWESNCQKFIFNELIPEALSGLKQALFKCNGILSMHFKKCLIEYQLFNKDENNDAKINMQDLIFYQQNIHNRGGVIWKIYSADTSKDVEEIHQELNLFVGHLLSFDHLFMINGYDKNQIYCYVIQRFIFLSQNAQNFNYAYAQNPKYPTDSQIILHLFVIFLNQIQINNSRVKSFVKERGQIMRKEEILIEQLSEESREPYFVVNYMNEQWFPKPGKDNILSAIAFFFYGLKYRLQDYEKREYKPEINRKIDQIVSKNKL